MSTSLAPMKRFNRDGSRIIYCRQCREPVGLNSILMNFGSVICVLCNAANNNEVLPDNVVEEIKASRLALVSNTPGIQFIVQQAKVEEEARKTDPMSAGNEDRISMRYWFKAAGIKVVETFKDVVSRKSGAQALAREKKRKRIFDRPVEETLEDEDK